MAILENLFNSLFDQNDSGSSAKPCKNCPSSCTLCPDSCEVCKPYKEKLLDLLYDVEHLEEYYARYEVVANAADQSVGNVSCPHCGAPNPASACACEYCGSQLRESSGKIQVASAKDIPDPLQLAQDTIFERLEAVNQNTESGGSLLDGIVSLLGGDRQQSIGDHMTDDEIKQTARSYGVSLATYLQGLDNGTYLTASAKAAQGCQSGGMAGAASLGALGLGSILGNSMANNRPSASHGRPPFPPAHAPQSRPGSNRPGAYHAQPDHRPGRPDGRPEARTDNRPDHHGRPEAQLNHHSSLSEHSRVEHSGKPASRPAGGGRKTGGSKDRPHPSRDSKK